MKFPFVSRERFDEQKARADKFEHELAESRATVLKLTERFARQEAEEQVDLNKQDLSKIKPAGRPTVASIIQDANTAAFKAAESGVSIAEQVNEKNKVAARKKGK